MFQFADCMFYNLYIVSKLLFLFTTKLVYLDLYAFVNILIVVPLLF